MIQTMLNIFMIFGFIISMGLFIFLSTMVDTSAYDGAKLIIHEIKIFKYHLFMFIFIIIGILLSRHENE